MGTTGGERVFVDTNVLVYTAARAAPLHATFGRCVDAPCATMPKCLVSSLMIQEAERWTIR